MTKLFALLALLPLTLGAQAATVHTGQKIRFTIGGDKVRHEAILAQLTSDSMAVEACPTCQRLRFARSEVSELQVLRKRASGANSAIGFGGGLILGLIAGAVVAFTCQHNCDTAGIAVPALGVVGALIGGISGYLGAYSWETVALDGA